MSPHGLLILNLGTPASPNVSDVRRYLALFLSDKRVITLPWIWRYLLLYAFVLPFRSRKTARAYQKIWTSQGAPLLLHSEALATALQASLRGRYEVRLAMRYGEPSIESALQQLSHCHSLTILPLYPQYASASTGSCLEKTLLLLAQTSQIPTLHIIHSFYQHPAFIQAQADIIRPHLKPEAFLLFSYHGLPEQHLHAAGCNPVCKGACPRTHPAQCYRAQCFATTTHLAAALSLKDGCYDTAFQSRLGVAPWTQPYLLSTLKKLAKQGVKHLIIACPSFTADCLETLEEIGDRARKKWLSLGGNDFTLVPCLNASKDWVSALTKIIS